MLPVCFDTNVFDQLAKRRLGSTKLQMDGDVLDRLWKAIDDSRVQPHVTQANLEWECLSAIKRVDRLIRVLTTLDDEPISDAVSPGHRQGLVELFRAGFRILRAPLIGGGPVLDAADIPANAWIVQSGDDARDRQDRADLFQRRHWRTGKAALAAFGLDLAELHGLIPPGTAQRYLASEERAHCAYLAWTDAKAAGAIPQMIQDEFNAAFSARTIAPIRLWAQAIVSEHDTPKRTAGVQKVHNKVREITAEWTDMRSLAACYGYRIPLFCTRDGGGGAGSRSVLHDSNWPALKQDWGIEVITAEQLLAKLGA